MCLTQTCILTVTVDSNGGSHHCIPAHQTVSDHDNSIKWHLSYHKNNYTIKFGFYTPWIHVYLDSVHNFISPTRTSIRTMLNFPVICFCFLPNSLIICSKWAENDMFVILGTFNCKLGSGGELVFGCNFLSHLLSLCKQKQLSGHFQKLGMWLHLVETSVYVLQLSSVISI